jgi:hypothetical protein
MFMMCSLQNLRAARAIVQAYAGTERETRIYKYILQICIIERGADKPLARPTSRCRRTESIVSFERRICSCAELQVFSCYRG